MSAIRLVILGVGTVRCMLPVVASLATYFGERPLEIVMFDADEERLDLVDRFARLAFTGTKANHSLRSTEDPVEALEDAELVIIEVEENCARKMLRTRRGEPAPVVEAIRQLLARIPEGTPIMSLIGDLPYDGYFAMDWPPPLTEAEAMAVPHQILRYLNGEEYLHQLLKEHHASPLKAWLNDPTEKARVP